MITKRAIKITKTAVIDKIENIMSSCCCCTVDCDYCEPDSDIDSHQIFVQIDFKNDYISEFYVEFNIPEEFDDIILSNLDEYIENFIQFGFADNSIMPFSETNFWKMVTFNKRMA